MTGEQRTSKATEVRRCYVSHSIEARNMLAVWLDDAPNVGKEQRDPDGWTTGAARTDFIAARLAELALAPNVSLRWLDGAAAEWWSRIEQGRRRAEAKRKNQIATDAVIPLIVIPKDIEDEGLRVGYARAHAKGRKR